MSEAEIINGLQQGDEKIFRELVDNYRQMVVNTCYGLLHNIEDAEDVAQDVFIEIFRSAENFRGESKISTWIYRIAVNRSLNFIRDNKRKKWFQPFDSLMSTKQNRLNDLRSKKSDNPDFNLENSERSAILHKAIDSLPENQKTAFTLNKYEDLSYKEISEVMEISLASVESLIHRAKKNLQKKLYSCYKKKCI